MNLSELWSMDKMQSAFRREYETKTKYKCSAFLKSCGLSHIEDHDDSMMERRPKRKRKLKRKRSEFERRHKADDELRFQRFVEEQCFILALDQLFPFLLDFDEFIDVLCDGHYSMYHRLLDALNHILLHFLGSEKWWLLQPLMMVYHDLMAHSVLMDRFKTSLDRDQDSKHHDLAMNIKYGIYTPGSSID